jgi:EAL domain-containing protein (putative c-di-GMP-specific phosphodiesterase class I)
VCALPLPPLANDEDTGLPTLPALGLAIQSVPPPYTLVALDFGHLAGVCEVLDPPALRSIVCSIARVVEGSLSPGDLLFRTDYFGFHVLRQGQSGVADDAQPKGNDRCALNHLLEQVSRPLVTHGLRVSMRPRLAAVSVVADQDYETPNALIARLRRAALLAWRANDREPVWGGLDADDASESDDVLGAELSPALESQRIQPWFQPICLVRTGVVSHVDSVLRWAHPRLGYLEAERIRRIAASLGMAQRLDSLALDSTLRALVMWRSQGVRQPVCLEFYPESISDRFFADRFATKCKNAGIEPSELVVQVPEAAFHLDGTEVRSRLSALTSLGASVWVRGGRQLPAIATSFVGCGVSGFRLDWAAIAGTRRQADENAALSMTLRSIARTQGVQLVAGDLTTPEQAKLLEQQPAISLAQGNLIGPPMQSEAMPAFLRKRGPADPARISPFSI